MKRRNAIRLLSLSPAILIFNGCQKHQDSSQSAPPSSKAPQQANPSSATPEPRSHTLSSGRKLLIHGTALVGLYVGERLERFPQPVIRVVGIILHIGSLLIVKYLDEEETLQELLLSVSPAESDQLQQARKLVFVRQDSITETRPIDEIA